MTLSFNNEEECIDELMKIVMEKPLPDIDIITTASNTTIINTESDHSGLIIKYNNSDTVKVKPERPDPIKCTGLGCNAMIQQKTSNKVKLCTRCRNKVFRRTVRK